MDKLREKIAEAKSTLKKADHLTYITYPQVKELKLLYLIAENLYKTLLNGMESVLYYERLYKRLPVIPGSFEYEVELFKDRCIDRYNIDRRFVLLIKDMKSIVDTKKKGPIEFARRDKFVLCTEDFNTRVLDLQKIKNYLADTKEFMEKVNKVVRC